MQINRLFEIIYLLLSKKNITAKELAAHFEVSVRTILRDVDKLSEAGVPIYTTQGKGGGIALLDNYVLNKAAVTDAEQEQILYALQSIKAAGYPEANPVLSKMNAIFNKPDTDWIEVDFSRWGNSILDKERFELLKKAIIEKYTITFLYINANGEVTDRKVHPLKLVFKSKAWYLQGYCSIRNDYRIFKISRIFSIKITAECFAERQFTVPPMEPPVSHPQSHLVHLKLLFLAEIAYRVYDEFHPDTVQKHEDGSLTVTEDWIEDEWLYSFLLSYGAAVQVLEPEHVKQQLLLKIEEIKNLY